MKILLRGIGVVTGLLGVALRTFGMPGLNHMPIGSRCGGCRYDGSFRSCEVDGAARLL